MEKHRFLSLWQPWAFFYVAGLKQYETRSWSTRHRGPLLIHAAQKRFSKADEQFYRKNPVFDAYWTQYADRLQRGAIIGQVTIVDSEKVEVVKARLDWQVTNRHITAADRERELAFGDYTPGRYAFRSIHPAIFEEPIPIKGGQGFQNYVGPLPKIVTASAAEFRTSSHDLFSQR